MRHHRRGRVVLTILVLLAFTLITLDYRSGALGGARSGAGSVFGPVEGALDDVVHPVGSFFDSLGHLDSYKDENSRLRAQISQLRTQRRLTPLQQARLVQLQKIYHLAGLARFHVVAANVSAVGSSLGFTWTATIDRGSDNGIAARETVIDGDGLVGRVQQVSATSSTIVLANDPQLTVGARLAQSQELGSVTGGGTHAMTLTLFSGSAALAKGDELVTAGSVNDRPFVPEVPIGRVASVTSTGGSLEQTATVTPYVNFFTINEVAVVVGAPKNIKPDSLLPMSPSPEPTVTVTTTVAPHSSSSAPVPGTTSTP